MSARDLLRVLWSEGVKVSRRDDGTLTLVPAERVTRDVLRLAKDAKRVMAPLIAELPALGRCPICGDATGWPDVDQMHCVGCALIAAERLGHIPGDPHAAHAARGLGDTSSQRSEIPA